VAVPAQQNAKIVEPGHDALKLDAVHEKDRERNLGFANVIEKSVLQALRALCRHGLIVPFCPFASRLVSKMTPV
jgi:predicted GNAT family acetyltransferase